ncbi:MAG TPA: oligosaccharide flippase family protein, partial [Thermotogota bacterium]|nr:oligosaccharide flippase family protein [Thermotogota bacterium]
MYTVSEVTVVGINFKKRTYWHILVSILSAGVNFIGNYFLVPIYGAKGAALSTGVAYIVFFYTRTLISRKLFPVDYSLKKFSVCTLTLFFVSLINTFANVYFFEILSSIVGGIIILFVYRKEVRKGITIIRILTKKTVAVIK